MTSPVSGWYPDPSGRPGERWWNGMSWSDDTRPAQAAAAAPAAAAPQAFDGFGNPAAPGSTPPAYGSTPGYGSTPPPAYGSTPPPFATGGSGAGYGSGGAGAPVSFVSRNGYSLGTVAVTAAYVLILVFAHFAILGILPLFLAFRAVGRKEPLAWAAVAIGVVALIFGIYEFAR